MSFTNVQHGLDKILPVSSKDPGNADDKVLFKFPADRQLTFQFRLTIHIQGLIVLAVRLPWLCSLTVKHIVCADICHFTVQLLADIRNVLRAASVDSTYFRHVFIILRHVHGRPRCAVDHGIRIHIRNCLFYGVPIGDIQ